MTEAEDTLIPESAIQSPTDWIEYQDTFPLLICEDCGGCECDKPIIEHWNEYAQRFDILCEECEEGRTDAYRYQDERNPYLY